MDFLNQQIDLNTLPGIEDVAWKKIEPDYLKVLRFHWLIVSVVLLIGGGILVFFNSRLQSPLWLASIAFAFLLVSGLYLFFLQRSFHYRAYAIRQHDILYRHGWIVKHTEACPFNRIQHCSVNSGPLERKFRLASLTLYTAASSQGDLKISGLPEETANTLREFIMKKIIPYEGAVN
jgi:membrane protein YdbS with pleckstrin-like domain